MAAKSFLAHDRNAGRWQRDDRRAGRDYSRARRDASCANAYSDDRSRSRRNAASENAPPAP